MFTNTHYVHRVNKPAYREERCSQTHTMFTRFTTSIQGRKMFTNTQYVHTVQHAGQKDVHRHTICSHSSQNQHAGQKDVHKHTIASGNSVPSNTNIIFVGWGSVIGQCDKCNYSILQIVVLYCHNSSGVFQNLSHGSNYNGVVIFNAGRLFPTCIYCADSQLQSETNTT